jgi:predicted MFS family arabinose efflux permease
VIVFVPVFLQTVTGVSATESGVILLALLITATVSTIASGRAISKTGRYKRFPVIGLAIMAIGLLALSRMDGSTSQAVAAALLAVFGLGFGLVSQVLTVAIQNAVDRRDLGIATASANLFRSLGGAIGAAAFGAIFGGDLDALPTVFLVAAPAAIAGLLVVLLLEEVPLRGRATGAAR